MTPDRQTIAAARRDPAVFAEVLVGQPLWPHQQEVVHTPTRYRTLLAGRQSGKSRTLSILALHKAFTVAGSLTLLVSAGEMAGRDLLSACAGLAQSPLLAGSVLDEFKGSLTLTNGSEIRSVAASQRRIRGLAVDRLIVDEGCWVPNDVWVAAQFTTIAKPGSDIIVTSTPWGRQDGWLAQVWRAGEAGEDGYASWRWPSQASPLVDQVWLDTMRRTMTSRAYEAEVEAQWTDDAGAYFTAAELEQSTIPFPVIDPSKADGMSVIVGCDWGFSRDASAVALIEPDSQGRGYSVVFCEERYNCSYETMIERIVDIGDPRQNGFRFSQVFSETNGVGSMPTQVLERQLAASGIPARVTPVATTARTKEDAFGTLKMLMQQGKLKLPSHPSLLRQLAALEFETTETGTVKISVPERSGHDDLAMALALAATGISKPSGAMQFLSSISWQCACGTLNCRSEDFCQRCARRRGAEPPDAGDDGLPRSWGRW